MAIQDVMTADELAQELTLPVARYQRALILNAQGTDGDDAAAAADRITRLARDFANREPLVQALWDRAEHAEIHARRYKLMTAQNPVHARMVRIFETKRDTFLESVAVLRGGVFEHAMRDVEEEWRRRTKAA